MTQVVSRLRFLRNVMLHVYQYHSIGYFASKVPSSIPTREFSPEKLEAWVNETLADPDTPPEHKEVLESLTYDLDEAGPDYWYRELSDIWGGNDPPDWSVFNSNFLWCRDAIRWFVTHHDEAPIQKPQ